MDDAVVVIPARYGSTRLAGKPLIDLAGLPMLAHVIHRVMLVECVIGVVVATDDARVAAAAAEAGARAVLTDAGIANGTLRVASVFEGQWEQAPPFIVQVNGDEPLLPPENVAAGLRGLQDSDADASVLVHKSQRGDDPTEFKAVLDIHGDVMYMSRAPIPSDARGPVPYYLKCSFVTSFRKETLRRYPSLPVPEVELLESNNELRLIASGFRLRGVEVEHGSLSVDVPLDVQRAVEALEVDPVYASYAPERC